jgi:hypothetical protein
MGMDVDYVTAKQSIDELLDVLGRLEHGKREEIADDIIEFVDKMKEKHVIKQ